MHVRNFSLTMLHGMPATHRGQQPDSLIVEHARELLHSKECKYQGQVRQHIVGDEYLT